MEGREMHRDVRPEMLHDPAGHGVDLRLAVVLAGDDQVGDLQPHRGLASQIDQRVEHRLQPALGDVAIEPLGERLEVDVRSEEHTSELQSLMRISYAVFCLKKKKKHN